MRVSTVIDSSAEQAKESNPTPPNAHIRSLAHNASNRLSPFAGEDLDISLPAHSRKNVTLPAEAVRLLVSLLAQLADGNAVTIVPHPPEFTSKQAADFLGVSRPFLVKQLNAGAIAFRKVGTHHRIRLEDLVAYKNETAHKRLKTLDELSALDQELGLQ